MGHRGRHPILTQALHRFIDYPALYFDIVYVHTPLSEQFAIGSDSDIQANFDKFYEEMHILLDQFYPEREISVTSADPRFVTPIIKSMLRRKNRLMRSGRLMKPMR